MDLPENLTEHLEADQEKQSKNISSKEMESSYVFMTSGIAAEEQEEFFTFLESLGVAFNSGSVCDPKATHVIAQKIARSEKMLGSIASGKWLLHPTYITDCKEVGKLLPEDKYEWGNPNNDLINDLSTELEVKLAKASHRLRAKREKGLDLVFSGIKAIIHTSDQRKASFKKLLELGGGQVLDNSNKVRPPYSDSKDATHCIAEPNKLPKVSIDYKALAMRGVAVVNPVYINEFLANDPPPCVDNHLIEEFKQYWKIRQAS